MEMNVNVCVVLISFVFGSLGLEVLKPVTNNNIVETASVIRNVTNEIFIGFKLKRVKKNAKLRKYSVIHNYFTSISLKDHKTLNLITKASRFDTTKVSNETRGLIEVINEILNEDPTNTTEETYKDGLNEHISEFLINLEHLKDNNDVNDNNLDINDQILDILRKDEYYNVSKNEEIDANDNLISDNEFWVPEKSGRRIFRGDTTKFKRFPFMASIQIFNNFQCGGCIIKSDIVITAASCLQLAWNNRFFRENPAFLAVRVGSTFFKGGGETISVLEVYFHPDYDPKTLKNNICLLRLIRKINFRKKNKIKKIDFDRSATSLSVLTDGITIVGWGAKGVNNIVQNPWNNKLSFAVLDLYPLYECQDIYSKRYVTRKNFCAGFFSKGGGACNGDVGGPGIADGVLAGIISFGSPVCGTPDAPTVFTKLGFYADWIESIFEQEVPNAIMRTTLKSTRAPITFPKHNTLKPTTFILEPVDSKDWTPKDIKDADKPDHLRILKDEELFKEFLSTMFGSKEAKEYEELFADVVTDKNKIIVKKQKKVKKHRLRQKTLPDVQTEETERVTESFEYTTKSHRFTVLETNISEDKASKETSSDDNADGDRTRGGSNDDDFGGVGGDGDGNVGGIVGGVEGGDVGGGDGDGGGGGNVGHGEGNEGGGIVGGDGDGGGDDDENDIEVEKNILKLIENIDITDEEDVEAATKEEDNIVQMEAVKGKENEKDFSEYDALELILDPNVNIPKIKENPKSKESEPENDAFNIEINDYSLPREKIKKRKRKIVPGNDALDHLLSGGISKDKNFMKDIDDSILTYIYLSDSEKKKKPVKEVTTGSLNEDEHVNDSISIALEGFKDLTFRDNGTGSVFNFLPKDEIYDLLAETIDEVALNVEK